MSSFSDFITKLLYHVVLFCDTMSIMVWFRSPRRRRSRSSSRSRRGRPEHSRPRERRWRSRSGDRSERENRERRQKGLPTIKSHTLSGMYHCQQSPVCECIIQSGIKASSDAASWKMLLMQFCLISSLQYYTMDWTAGQENPAVWCGVPFRRVWPDWVN